MIFGSVCSGIEAASCAWHPLGWRAAFVSDIEKFPSAVLAHHYPDVPNYGDMTNFKEWPDHAIDFLVGGTPCQSFSVAGLRKGLADPRGNLMLTYLAIADRYRPRWLGWENVPGVLSSNGGRDFGTFLGALGQLGYGFAYRVLDAQYFGVPQRRRRVFVVGYLGDWRRAAAVLFERHSLSGHPAPRRETGEGASAPTAPSLTASGRGVERTGESRGQDPVIAMTLNAKGGAGRQDAESETFITHSLRADGFDASEDGTGRGTPLVPVVGTMKSMSSSGGWSNSADHAAAGYMIPVPEFYSITDGSHANGGGQVAIAIQEVGKRTGVSTNDPRAGIGIAKEGDPMFTLQAGAQHGVGHGSAVRRLTPRECERLQGFPDDYTLIPYRGKPAADGPRYKALGNSMAVPVMRWIGERIAEVDKINPPPPLK